MTLKLCIDSFISLKLKLSLILLRIGRRTQQVLSKYWASQGGFLMEPCALLCHSLHHGLPPHMIWLAKSIYFKKSLKKSLKMSTFYFSTTPSTTVNCIPFIHNSLICNIIYVDSHQLPLEYIPAGWFLYDCLKLFFKQ